MMARFTARLGLFTLLVGLGNTVGTKLLRPSECGSCVAGSYLSIPCNSTQVKNGLIRQVTLNIWGMRSLLTNQNAKHRTVSVRDVRMENTPTALE